MDALSQSHAPLVHALQAVAQCSRAAFYTPGHKGGAGISSLHRSVFGDGVFQLDVPELPELDDLFSPETVIADAQFLAAEAFGAEQTWFLVNGSTCGVEAAMLAACGPGDKVLVPRNAHQSVLSGLILSGAIPIWISPVYEPEWRLALGVTVPSIVSALAQHPDVKAVMVVSPTYEGVCSDIASIAAVVHGYDLPLIVDAAHGPHFVFHADLPASALQGGADIVIHSAHKVLATFTQSAMLHVRGDRCDRNRLNQALRITQSSSPNYLLLAALDAARHQMANQGHALMEHTLTLAQAAREQLQTEGMPVLNAARLSAGAFQQDLTRLTVDVSGLGITGFEADEWLHARGVTAELPTLHQLTFIISLGNSWQDIDSLVQGITQLPRAECPPVFPQLPGMETSGIAAMSPRDAFFANTALRSMEGAIGHISADTVCIYPPGIPTLMPGETVTSDAIHSLRLAQQSGAHVSGLADATAGTLRVVDPGT